MMPSSDTNVDAMSFLREGDPMAVSPVGWCPYIKRRMATRQIDKARTIFGVPKLMGRSRLAGRLTENDVLGL
jgi:hypothetical protein